MSAIPFCAVALAGLLPACSAPSPPAPIFIPDPTANAVASTSERPASPQPRVAAEGVISPIVGVWDWQGDVVVYRADDTGTYFREGSICYEFKYRIEGDVLTETADRDSECQGRRENSYHVEVSRASLRMKHIGSGFESEWERSTTRTTPSGSRPSGMP
jgi:hypothetical protein